MSTFLHILSIIAGSIIVYYLGALVAVFLRNAIGSPLFGFHRITFNGRHPEVDLLRVACWPVAIVLWDLVRLAFELPMRLTRRVLFASNAAGDRIEKTKNRYITGGKHG